MHRSRIHPHLYIGCDQDAGLVPPDYRGEYWCERLNILRPLHSQGMVLLGTVRGSMAVGHHIVAVDCGGELCGVAVHHSVGNNWGKLVCGRCGTQDEGVWGDCNMQ